MNAFHRILLVAIAIALMSFAAASTQAGNVTVRTNRFTPFNVRPDVRVNANGHHGGNVNVQVNGANVRVNGFHGHNFRRNDVDVFVSGGHSGVLFVPQFNPVVVTPNFIVPLDTGYGFGVSVRANACFRGSGGCCNH